MCRYRPRQFLRRARRSCSCISIIGRLASGGRSIDCSGVTSRPTCVGAVKTDFASHRALRAGVGHLVLLADLVASPERIDEHERNGVAVHTDHEIDVALRHLERVAPGVEIVLRLPSGFPFLCADRSNTVRCGPLRSSSSRRPALRTRPRVRSAWRGAKEREPAVPPTRRPRNRGAPAGSRADRSLRSMSSTPWGRNAAAVFREHCEPRASFAPA